MKIDPARPDLFKECGKLEIEDIEWKLHDSKKSLDFPVMTNTEVHRLQNLVKDGRIRVVWKDPGADEDSDAEAWGTLFYGSILQRDSSDSMALGVLQGILALDLYWFASLVTWSDLRPNVRNRGIRWRQQAWENLNGYLHQEVSYFRVQSPCCKFRRYYKWYIKYRRSTAERGKSRSAKWVFCTPAWKWFKHPPKAWISRLWDWAVDTLLLEISGVVNYTCWAVTSSSRNIATPCAPTSNYSTTKCLNIVTFSCRIIHQSIWQVYEHVPYTYHKHKISPLPKDVRKGKTRSLEVRPSQGNLFSTLLQPSPKKPDWAIRSILAPTLLVRRSCFYLDLNFNIKLLN